MDVRVCDQCERATFVHGYVATAKHDICQNGVFLKLFLL